MGLSLMVGPALGGRSGEESDVDILILAQFLQRGHDLASDELLALGCALCRWGWGGGFQLAEGRAFVRQPLEDVDQDGVGLGDVEADVGDRVLDEAVQDGENGAGEDGEGEGWGEGLNDFKLARKSKCFATSPHEVSFHSGSKKGAKCQLTETAKQVVMR